MKQTINNACGTIGLIHAIANNRDKMNFGKFELRIVSWLVFLTLLAFPFFFPVTCGEAWKEGYILYCFL